MLQREDFTAERLQLLAQAALKHGEMPFITDVQRAASLQAVRDAIPAGQDVWIFGYGSLMWNPAIKVVESRKARVDGYSACFCLSLRIGRGSPEKPGLMLGLDKGDVCVGMAHRIAASDIESELTVLWFREMLSGAYAPQWVDVEIDSVGRRRAVTFVINRAHPRYEGGLDEDTVASRIAHGEGFLGTNRDYLYRTVDHLNALGVTDGPLHRLAMRVHEIAKGGNRT